MNLVWSEWKTPTIGFVDMDKLLAAITDLLKRQHDSYRKEIQFQESNADQAWRDVRLTKNLKFKLSYHALELLVKQIESAKNWWEKKITPTECTNHFRAQHGVPCAHEIFKLGFNVENTCSEFEVADFHPHHYLKRNLVSLIFPSSLSYLE